jgi:endo-1,4-beta-xylanase
MSGGSRPGLRAVASGGGRYFGTAVQAAALSGDDALRSTLTLDCASITPEWAMKWDALAPKPGAYNFNEMDRLADFAGRNGLALRGHTLLWHKSMPGWAASLIGRTRQWQHVEAHLEKVMMRYGSRIREWDVVNEPIEPNDGDSGLRNNQLMRAFGQDYIEWAFWSAHKFAPNARKLINEFGLEYNLPYEGQRRLSLLHLLARLKSRNVPVDTVGLQAHLDLRKGTVYRDGIHGMIRDITAMGLKIVITELDVTEADMSLPLARRDSLVADETRRYLDIVLDFGSVIGVNTWGLSDSYSWLRSQRSRSNRGLPYDVDWQPKLMHEAIRTALD